MDDRSRIDQDLPLYSQVCRDHSLAGELDACARQNLNKPLPYQWTDTERNALDKFVTNTNGRVFLIFRMQSTLGGVLFTMCGRARNPRGIRGVFVDHFLPLLLSAGVAECQEKFDNNAELFLRQNKISDLDGFVNHSSQTARTFEDFLKSIGDSSLMRKLADSPAIKRLFSGNTMTGNFIIGFEAIPILAAETLQLLKPGFGSEVPDSQISNYYLEQEPDVSDHYPIEEELGLFKVNIGLVKNLFDASFGLYNKWRGRNFDGPLPEFFRKKYVNLVKKEDLEKGIIGETCDVLGNFAPACILTSLGMSVNEQDFPQLLCNLLSNPTPANVVIVDMLREQAQKIGYDLERHLNFSRWQNFYRRPLLIENFVSLEGSLRGESVFPSETVSRILEDILFSQGLGDWHKQFKQMSGERLTTDCLPDVFKAISFGAFRRMSFRCWLGLLRWKFYIRQRTSITPKLDFYGYTKPCPEELENDFFEALNFNKQVWQELEEKNVPLSLRQYVMSMGNKVGCYINGSLWLWESIIEQATKFNVHHEVRSCFLGFYNAITGSAYPYLRDLFRVDQTKNYLFAATSTGVELSDKEAFQDK